LLSFERRGIAAEVSLLARPRSHTVGHLPPLAAVGYLAPYLHLAARPRGPRACPADV